MSLSKAMGVEAKGDAVPFADKDDNFVITPPEPVTAFIEHAAFDFLVPKCKKIWEPACGDGAISKVLEAAGYDVISTNINDRGYGETDVDFLKTLNRRADVIVTNPPFDAPTGTAAQFLRHAGHLEVPYVAMFLKSTFMAAGRDRAWMQEPRWRPSIKLELTWRIDWTGGGNPTMEMAWFVWENPGQAIFRKTGQIDYLRKPQEDGFLGLIGAN